MSAMCQAGFDVIDVYPMTDSNPEAAADNVHYRHEVFDTMETMLEKYKILNNSDISTVQSKRRIKRCI